MEQGDTSCGVSRRSLLAGLATAPALGASALARAAAQAPPSATDPMMVARRALATAKGTKLVILGSGGGPVVGLPRHMTSHAIVGKGAAYIVDCGLGVTAQAFRAGVQLRAVRDVFVTHHHPDHNVEYGPLLLLTWLYGRATPIGAYGPPPLAEMTADYVKMQKYTTDVWSADYGEPPFPRVDVHELTAAGPVMRDDLVTVTCAVVQHPPIKPAFGYRFDFHDRSIVFSGDTVAVPAVAALAKDADVLVHEAMYYPAVEKGVRSMGAAHQPDGSIPLSRERMEQILAHMRRDHTPAVDVGRIASEAGVKTLVLSHLVPSYGVPDDFWRAQAAKTFNGKIVVAHDLIVV